MARELAKRPVPAGDGVLAYYCDSNKCNVDEYCCGLNICCTSYAVWQMWYFWCGLAFFVVLLSACAGICKYRYQHASFILHTSYSRLENPPAPSTTYVPPNIKSYSDDPSQYSQTRPPVYTPNYPPPPYAQDVHTVEKDANYFK